MTVCIHEQIPYDGGEHSDYSRALGFVGEASEVQRCVTYLSSCVLGAVVTGQIDSAKAASICETLVDEPPAVFRKDAADFIRVVEGRDRFSNRRKQTIVAAAAEGKLSTPDMRKELAVRRYATEIQLLSHEGRVADARDGQLTVRVLDLDDMREMFSEELPEFQIAQEMGLTHFVWQRDLVKSGGDAWEGRHHMRTTCEHVTLGTVNAEGVFEDVITVLDMDHPVRQGLTPGYES